MNKLALIFAGVFSIITVFAVATDYAKPEGLRSTPRVTKDKNLRERSVYVRGSHRGFMHGK